MKTTVLKHMDVRDRIRFYLVVSKGNEKIAFPISEKNYNAILELQNKIFCDEYGNTLE